MNDIKHAMNVRIFFCVIGALEKKSKASFITKMDYFIKNSFLRCTSTFECINEKHKHKRIDEIHTCTNIKQVVPDTISIPSSNTQVIFLVTTCFISVYYV